MHELIHIERGEGTCQPEYIEMQVRYETAMRLLPDLDTVPCEGDDLTAVAKAWGVTRRVLMDRAVTLTKDQAMSAGCFSCLKCPSQAAKMRSAINELVDQPRYPWFVARAAVAA